MTWLIEDSAFANGDVLLPALQKLNKHYIIWDDKFWASREYLNFPKDVCESEGNFFLVEMNPFSGADLYYCDAEKIILEIEKLY